MTSVAFIGNSVPDSLIVNFRSSNHPDLRVTGVTNVGCDPLDAPRFSDGATVPDREGCAQWRDSWTSELQKDRPDVVVYFVAQTMVTDRMVDGRLVKFGSSEWNRLLEDSLDKAEAAAAGSRFAVVNLACHRMPTFSSEEIERVNDTDVVTALNESVETWAKANDVPVLDQYSLLCPGDEYHSRVNGVPLYEDAIHFTDRSGPIFWRWLAPRLQQISRGEDPS